jgi:mycothiol system anti-sigma-R factor
MECTTALSMVYVFIDGELDEVHRIEVTAHIAQCAPCEVQFAAQINIQSRIRRSCSQDHAPAHVRTAILARIRGAQPPVE